MPISSPLRLNNWIKMLANFPDENLKHLIITGIVDGVKINYCGPRDKGRRCRNLPSAFSFPDAITDDIEKEVSLGRIAGPYSSPPHPQIICSPLGSVPKKNSTKRRRIHHLSFPAGKSINDFHYRHRSSLL
jgi:hypothetical protein